MSPDFQEGDFVALATAPFFLKRLKIGDTIIFNHKLYGTLIKRIASFDPETAEAYVKGTRPDSKGSSIYEPVPLYRNSAVHYRRWYLAYP